MKIFKTQKGVTMISLILYVASFFAITIVVGIITTFFYSNMQIMDLRIGSSSEYNKLNLYLLNECKKPGATIYAIKGTNKKSDDGSVTTVSELTNLNDQSLAVMDFVTFKSDNGLNTFIYDEEEKNLYYNSIKLCQDVNDFQMKLDKTTGKDVLVVLININGTSFQTKYVVGS